MHRFTRALVALLSIVMLAGASAQAFDVELGHEWSREAPRVYALARLNLPMGSAFGADSWLLPELGAGVPYTDLSVGVWGYARVQALFDAPAATLFLDALADTHGAARLRAGVRFGFDLR